VIGVFARPNHPSGYGTGGDTRTAHGYVVILVRCKDDGELAAVQKRLSTKGLGDEHFGPANWWSTWYGGQMDLVAMLPKADQAVVVNPGWGYYIPRSDITKASIGDNRYVAVIDAGEILT
jgi:hypothetical protein